MSKRTLPTPWRTFETKAFTYVCSNDDDTVGATGRTRRDRETARRIVRAVNAYESPVARAARKVLAAIRHTNYWGPGREADAFRSAVSDWLAAQMKAKKVKTK